MLEARISFVILLCLFCGSFCQTSNDTVTTSSATSPSAVTVSATAAPSTASSATTSTTSKPVSSTTSVSPTATSGQQSASVTVYTPTSTNTNNTGSTTAPPAGPITCYKCNNKDCIPLEGQNNTDTCKGSFCWTYYDAKDSKHVRGCSKDAKYFNQDTCSSETFQYAATGICSRCCKTNECNSVKLSEQEECSGNTGARLSFVALLYLSSVLAYIC